MSRILHGRTAELDAIANELEVARGGLARALAVVGEPGIGKTRLTIEAAARAAGTGFIPCWGRAWEAGGAPPYWPWRLLFESMPGIARDGELAQLWGRGAGPAADPDQARFALFDAVASAIRAASATTPLLCVLDDLHAADVPSLELAAFATRDLRSSRVVWLMTWRTVEAERAPVRDLIASIARGAAVFALPRLSARESYELIDEIRADTPPEVRETLARATGGNPLFLLETLACLAARGAIDVERLPLAQGVGAIVRERLAPLPPAVRRLLEMAAILGRDVAVARWAAAADAPLELVRKRATEIVATGILDELGPDRWRFSHELVRDAIVRETPTEHVAAAHRRLALALDRDVRLGDLSAIGDRAHHALLALPDLDRGQAIEWTIAAADHARAQCAYEEALAIVQRALAAIGAPARAHAGLQLAIGRVHLDLNDPRAARDAFGAAIEIARAAGDPEMVARGVLGIGSRYIFGDILDELVASIDRAAADLPADARDLHARLLARKSAALTPGEHPDEVLDMAREAIALVADSTDSETRLDVAVAAGSAFADFAHPRERIRLNEELVRLARARGDRALELRGLSRLVTDHIEAGNFARADAVLAERDELARELKLPRFAWQAPVFRSMQLMARGEFAACDAALAEAEAIAAPLADANAIRTFTVHRSWLALLAERTDELTVLEPALLRAWRTIPSSMLAFVRAFIRFRTGQLEDARRELATLDLELPYGAPNWLASIADAAAALGEPALQRAIYDRLAPRADTYAVWGPFGLTCGPPIAASLGLLAAALGDRERAASHFDAARAMTTSADTRGLARWVEVWRERALGSPAPATVPETALATPAVALKPQAGAWLVEHSGGSFLVPNVRGMAMLAQLLARPDVEIHALELVSGSPERGADAGDAGEVLDAKARDAYRRRAAELTETLEQAEGRGDARRAEAAERELEVLRRELSRAVGLGGRTRRTGAAAERARITAQRRVREAIKKIADHAPALGEELDQAVQTGTYCVYRISPK